MIGRAGLLESVAHVRVGSADQVRAELKKSRTRLNWRVQFAPEALDQLRRFKKHFANAGASMTAERYVDSIVDFCMKLQSFPARGVARDDLLPPDFESPSFPQAGHHRLYVGDGIVSIVVDFHGGQDYEATLAPDEDR